MRGRVNPRREHVLETQRPGRERTGKKVGRTLKPSAHADILGAFMLQQQKQGGIFLSILIEVGSGLFIFDEMLSACILFCAVTDVIQCPQWILG